MPTRTATPDDQPFEFNLNAVKSEVDLAPFRFIWKTDDDPNRRFVMKHLQELNVWKLVEAADGGDMSAMIGAFQAAMSKDDWKVFYGTELPQYKLKALFDAYREHCGATEGESQASSDS
ncbi:hypothetical protein ACFXPN_20180 [Streptomyces griseorubiginosus]|jgi:hypothetical protein|uniref:hypothetical protein n=1 Tax=Streptomyces griseorubiginosus TaxID=67304 RepID=UPI0036A1F429